MTTHKTDGLTYHEACKARRKAQNPKDRIDLHEIGSEVRVNHFEGEMQLARKHGLIEQVAFYFRLLCQELYAPYKYDCNMAGVAFKGFDDFCDGVASVI